MSDKPTIIGISGGSGSGKSRLAQRIQTAFPEQTTIVEQDWYYHDLSQLTPKEEEATNFDHPSAIEHTLLYQHLQQLIRGETVAGPDYHYASHCRRERVRSLEPKPLILLEGLFALYWPEIRKLLQIKLYLDVESDVRLERRLLRDTRERGYSAAQVRASWEQYSLPMHAEFVEPTAKFADFIWETREDTAFESTFLADLRKRLAKNGKNPK